MEGGNKREKGVTLIGFGIIWREGWGNWADSAPAGDIGAKPRNKEKAIECTVVFQKTPHKVMEKLFGKLKIKT